MTMDGTYTAVVDRFEDDLAVLVLELDDGADELVVDRSRVPDDAGQDAVLQVVLEDGALADATYDSEETERRREAVQDRFDRLARRPPRDDE